MITTLITGASKGIGMETAMRLLIKGCSVCAVSRSREGLNNLVEFAEKHNKSNDLLIYTADVSNELEVAGLVRTFQKRWNHLNILINNAGLLINKPFEQIKYEDFESVYRVNVYAPLMLSQRFNKELKAATWGHIVNISSVGGVGGSSKFPGLSVYSSSKGALNILSECLSEELKETNISVNSLALGAVQTKMLEEAFPGYKAPISADMMGEYIADFALQQGKLINGQIFSVKSSNP